MGLFDFFDDLATGVSQFVEGVGELGEIVIESVGELGEIVGEFGEGLEQITTNIVHGEPDKPICTSFDVRDEAKKIIGSAKKDFSSAKEKLIFSWQKTSQEAESVAQKRKEIYQLLGQALSTALVILSNQPVDLICPAYAPSIDSMFDAGTALGYVLGPLSTNIRMEAAEEYLQQAKEYRADMLSRVNQMDSLRRIVYNVSDALEEEKAMLDIIHNTYRQKKHDIIKKSADILHETSLLFMQEITENTDKKYNELLNHLKSLWY